MVSPPVGHVVTGAKWPSTCALARRIDADQQHRLARVRRARGEQQALHVRVDMQQVEGTGPRGKQRRQRDGERCDRPCRCGCLHALPSIELAHDVAGHASVKLIDQRVEIDIERTVAKLGHVQRSQRADRRGQCRFMRRLGAANPYRHDAHAVARECGLDLEANRVVRLLQPRPAFVRRGQPLIADDDKHDVTRCYSFSNHTPKVLAVRDACGIEEHTIAEARLQRFEQTAGTVFGIGAAVADEQAGPEHGDDGNCACQENIASIFHGRLADQSGCRRVRLSR